MPMKRFDSVRLFLNEGKAITYREGRKGRHAVIPVKFTPRHCPSREGGEDNYTRMTRDRTIKNKKEREEEVSDKVFQLKQERISKREKEEQDIENIFKALK